MKKAIGILLSLVFLLMMFGSGLTALAADDVTLSDDASDFVLLSEAVPDAILEIRYYSTYNFVGDRIDGYEEPVALLTREAAEALRAVSDDLIEQGYRLKIYDAYRPQMAVTNFMNWALDTDDTRMKEYFYPELEKDVLFPLGYIAEHSGHSRGSTVDLTLFDMTTEKEVDMGGTFDYFGELSHPDYTGITEEQYANRMILREAMLAHGFKPLEEEWWHFTLADEPYPDTYFTFPVSTESVASAGEDPLSLWTEGAAAKEELTAYMAAITDEAGADYIPPEDRVAVFDLDGTLFCETDPNYFDYTLLVYRVLEDPDYRDQASDFEREVAEKIVEQNETGASFDGLEVDHGAAVASAFSGMTLDEFNDYIQEFKKLPMPSYEGMTRGEGWYRPMLQVVEYLQANGFTVYIVSGTDRFIVRGIVDGSPLDIPPRQIIGSDETVVTPDQGDEDGLSYVFDDDDELVLGGDFVVKNLKMNKVAVIAQEIGQQPVLSFGNSTGDSSMAAYVTTGNPYPSLAFMLCCDDTERENGSTEKADKMYDLCGTYGWIPVSMKNDWTTIYGDGVTYLGGGDSLSAIRESGVLRVGTTGDYKPMSFLDADTGEYWGFDTALAEDLAEALGVEIEYVPTTWPTLMEDTLAGKFDLAIGGITVTDARQEQALMSDGYLDNGKTVLCRAEDADKYTSLEAIDRPEVRVMENPGGLNEAFALENLPDAELIIHDVNEEIPGLIAAGEADVMITEIMEAGYYVGQDDRLAAPLIHEPFTQGQLGVLMPKGSEELLDFVNDFLAEEKQSGRIDELAEEYIYRYITEDLAPAA